MVQFLPESEKRLMEGAGSLLKAAFFTSDATLDALVFCSKALASANVARRGIWVRAWPADLRVKNIVSAYPFQGEKLFGDALERILIETHDKKKAMPRTLCRNDRRGFSQKPFLSSHTLARPRSDAKRNNWSQFKQPFRKNFSNQRFSRQSTKPRRET